MPVKGSTLLSADDDAGADGKGSGTPHAPGAT